MGSLHLGRLIGEPNIITTDMGGTSFDVGMIIDNQPATSFKSLINQYEYFIPKVDIQAIGAGGGSLARIDELTGTLHVGPDSAGAVPGPICYGRGGLIPTVTDADLVLGYFDADNFAGGKMTLNRRSAEDAIAAMGRKLGLNLDETAAGIARIAVFNMADLIRRSTVEKGQDPRDFVLFAFGGAGPVHAGVFARELGVKKVIVPQKKTASVWCAFGAASADILHVYEHVDLMKSPFDVTRINAILAQLKTRGAAQLAKEGMQNGRYGFSIDVRHRGQINEVEVPLAADHLTEEHLPEIKEEFIKRYEQIYGRGSAFRKSLIEALTFRVRATADIPKPNLVATTDLTNVLPSGAERAWRSVYWIDEKRRRDTPIYDGDRLVPGNGIVGPAIVETTLTTVVVHPGQSIVVDKWGNFELAVGGH